MKKFLALALSVVMVLSLAACGAKQEAAPAAPAATEAAPAATEAAPAEQKLDWPKKDITVICPFKAGGAMDLTTRLAAKYMEKYLGVNVTVSNVEGGNSWTGWTQVAQAKGDGYTLGFANFPAQVAGYMNPSAGVPFTYKDFTYIADVASDPNVLVVSQKYSQFTTAQEFFDYCKDHDVVVSTGGGAGADDDICIQKINKALGLNIESGRNSGDADAKAAMLGGHVDAEMANVSNFYATLNSTGDDAVRVLCIFAKERNAMMPDVPTIEECGYELIVNGSDRGLCATANLDPAIRDYLVEVFGQIYADPDFQADAASQGLPLGNLRGDDFTAFVAETEETINGLLEVLGWA